MSFFIGYHNGTHGGQCLTLDSRYFGLVNDDDADRIAESLRREIGREPAWQTVKSRLIRLAKQRRREA